MGIPHVDEEIIIDPTYGDRWTYAQYFDYDLRGRPLGFVPKIKKPNDFHYLAQIDKTDTALFVVGVILATFVLPMVWSYLCILKVYLFNRIRTRWQMEREKRACVTRKNFLQPDDPDQYAAIFCRSLFNRLDAATSGKQIPKDLADYEAIRFAVHQPKWLVNKMQEALQKAEHGYTINEVVSGELDDMLKLALKQKCIKTRKPLSLPGKLMARYMLAKGESRSQKDSRLTPEMLLLLGWQRLYRRHVHDANEENYAWWLSQMKTLPLESREVLERLQTIVDKQRKHRRFLGTKHLEELDPSSTDGSSLPREAKKPEIIEPTRKRPKRSTPKIEISPPELHRNERLISGKQDPEEAMMLREILGMEHLRHIRLRRVRQRRSGDKKRTQNH
ncbi:hypothetical protein T265_09789 [Opisthorchis viverrini]|uniref:Uncharacterized protein n=1 Tax=Opisthorchis viverrini TaxID=6198 RepID=A0A074Z8X0_OPIVI|nr:hypothetical protein T265_09789 [Opisthorchis viverrini]KER22037.1 hypothetical protein T265_09789 [Opisthorchis viverrini]